MSQLVITYDRETGAIADTRYVHGDYDAAKNELVRDDAEMGMADVVGKRVDPRSDPPRLIDDPEFTPIAVLRARFEASNPSDSERLLYRMVLRALGDDLWRREYRERVATPGLSPRRGWHDDPALGVDDAMLDDGDFEVSR